MRPAHPGQRRRRARLARGLLIAAAGAAVLWGGGLVWFAAQIPREIAQPERTTDAIVVLTGGAERLRAGLDLLARKRARKLFISGVYRGVEVTEILRLGRASPETVECCIELGYAAADTAGNARETAAWMAAEGFRSLRLVTAAYHMPRSLAEFRRAMPGIEIVAHPVFPRNVHLDAWWRWPGTTRLLASEFNKYLASNLRALIAGRGGRNGTARDAAKGTGNGDGAPGKATGEATGKKGPS